MKYLIHLILINFLIIGCDISSKETRKPLNKKEAIEAIEATQKALMSNLFKAIEKDGPAHAVEFCNVKAIPLTDSVSQKLNLKISRLSLNNRNPKNYPTNSKDLEILRQYELNHQNKKALSSVFDQENEVFYQPIKLAMPKCLNCHGSIEDDINPETLKVLKTKYPNDQATGYAVGDFRGIWKVEKQ